MPSSTPQFDFVPVPARLDDTISVAELLRIERLLSGLSASFISIPADQIDLAIRDSLRAIVEHLGLDRSTLSVVDPDSDAFRSTHSWAAKGFEPVPATNDSRTYPWATARLRSGQPVVFSRPEQLPPEAAVDRKSYERLGLRAHVGLPVMVAGKLVGVLGFGTLGHERAWPAALVARLQLVAEIFASALARKQAHLEIERALAFERLLAEVSASLLSEPARDPRRAIAGALRSIGELLEVDRVAVWRVEGARTRLELTHAWVRDGTFAPDTADVKGRLPQFMGKILRGEIVNIADIDDLPADAAADQAALRSLGTKAVLAVPLSSQGVVVGAISLAVMRARRHWPEALIPRVRLIGEVFAGVVAGLRAAEQMRVANSEAAQLRERLAHLVRVHTVGEMSGAIAHEINQPLVAIENYAHAARRRIAAKDGVDLAKLADLLDKIGDQAAHAGDVLLRLRTMLRKHDSEAVEFDLGKLASDTVRLVEVETRFEGFRVDIEVAPGLPAVFADPVQIQQVLLNLMRNAMEAMDEGGATARVLRVEVGAQDEDRVLARVIDAGPGIAPDAAKRIFEPFYSTKASGLGIGLSICRSIVQAHGGALDYSPNLAGGSVFEFTLPVAEAE